MFLLVLGGYFAFTQSTGHDTLDTSSGRYRIQNFLEDRRIKHRDW